MRDRHPSEVREIEAVLESRFQGAARLVPSGRLGLIVALESLLDRGDRVAMLASLCEVVAFSTYAAGLTPAFVDSHESGPTLDIDVLRCLEPGSIHAVVGTNLYGRPDDMAQLRALCRERRWKLIEDAAQVLESFVAGRRIGTLGDVAVFSFKKFFDEHCGALICHDGARLERIDELIRDYSRPAAWTKGIRARMASAARSAGMGWSRTLLQRLRVVTSRKGPRCLDNTRVAYGRELLSDAMVRCRPLAALDPILSLDDASYAVYPPKAQLERLLEKVRGWDRFAASVRQASERISRAAREADLPVLADRDGCYLAVPAMTRDRDEWAAYLWESERVRIENVYNPPLPDYLPEGTFHDLRKFPRRDLRWSKELLPIPTAHERRCVRALSGSHTQVRAKAASARP